MTQPSAAAPVTLVEGIGSIADRYDLILCDVWGVIHNGVVAYAPAADALTRFRERGGTVVLVSNAPRPGVGVAEQLDGFSVPRSAYDTIVTSGDLTRAAVEQRRHMVVHHMGPPRDHPIFDGLDVRRASIADADYVVCSGFDHEDEGDESVEMSLPRLEEMRARGLPMVCANPDLVVERGHRLIPCAGALALAYEKMGGEVFYCGKPHRPVYDNALAVAAQLRGHGSIALDRVLAVGDAIRTDIAGARSFGIDSLLVARGIHALELGLDRGALVSQHVQDWVSQQTARPTFVTDSLVWSA